MKQPKFWSRPNTKRGRLLAPIGRLYEKSVERRFKKVKPYQPQVPVICVGNICVGGSGKTPLCLALADFFLREGVRVYFLNHGYKSRLQNVLVDLNLHTADDISDEALLLAAKAPTIVDKNRARGVMKAEKLGAELIIMDDGFQNPSVKKTLSFIVFDGARGIGNGLCLPAGPLRETLQQGLKRASAAVILGPDKTELCDRIHHYAPDFPILHAELKMPHAMVGFRGIAFAGIGMPNKFFDMLTRNGVVLEQTYPFPDHYSYKRSDIEKMLARSNTVMTTEKDAVKVPPDLRSRLTVIKPEFVFDNPDDWVSVLKKVLK